MENKLTDVQSENLFKVDFKYRRKLLPWWIKAFVWIFLILGAFVPLSLLLGILGHKVSLSLYGLETNEPFSLIGIAIILLFAIKGISAYGFLKEKKWAVILGIIDAMIGILICLLHMFLSSKNESKNQNFTFRLELLILIPYLFYLIKIKPKWENPLNSFN